MPGVTLDLVLVIACVGAAASFLLYRLLKPAPPACHTLAAAQGRDPRAAGAQGPDVVVGAGLARGLKRAQARKRSLA